MRHTQINADILRADRQFLRFRHLTRKRDIPLIHFALDRDRLNLAFQRPMERDCCLADLGETERPFQLLALVFDGELPAGLIVIGETIIAMAALETREPRIFAMLAPLKEAQKSLIN